MRPTSSFVHGALKVFHVYLIIYSFNLTGIIHDNTLSHPLIIAVACRFTQGIWCDISHRCFFLYI